MKQIKIFEDGSGYAVETFISVWMKKNEDRFIVFHELTKYSTSIDSNDNIHHCVLIVYEERITQIEHKMHL